MQMVSKQASAAQTRQQLIEAALRVLQLHGGMGLTLDAVAQQAGKSKGGVLHHFPSKDALVEAVLRELFAAFETQVQFYLEQEPPGPGCWLRAYIRATFDDDPIPLELTTLLITVVENPSLIALIRGDFERWRQRLLDDGVPPARAMVVQQAADAYWTERLMGVAPSDEASRANLRDELLRLTRETRL
jgi:AcrR family transcriptional regulator